MTQHRLQIKKIHKPDAVLNWLLTLSFGEGRVRSLPEPVNTFYQIIVFTYVEHSQKNE